MIKTKRKSLVCVLLFTAFSLCFVLFGVNKSNTASAYVYSEYKEFFNYDGSAVNFEATVAYPDSIMSEYEANSFYIEVYSTEIEWSYIPRGPSFEGVTLTLTRPDKTTRTYSFGDGLKKDHFDETVFSAEDLLDGSGNVIEGLYTVQASGNITAGSTQGQSNSFSFYVDINHPTVSAKSNGQAIDSYAIVSSDVTVSASDVNGIKSTQYSRTTDSGYLSAVNTNFANGATFSSDGRYTVLVKDNFEKAKTLYFTIDKTAPSITRSCDEWTNSGFSLSVSDLTSTTIAVTKPNGEKESIWGKSYEVSSGEDNYGKWQFTVTDGAGHKSSTTVNYYSRNSFDNIVNVRDGYKLPTWWQVRLNESIFTAEQAGTYSFETFDAALEYAKVKERETRVTVLDTNKWSYVNAGNETVTQVYTDAEELNEVITQYALRYVSERKIVSANGTVIPNPTDANGVTRSDALNSQNVPLPSHLTEYSSLPRYYVRPDFIFFRSVEGVAGNTSTTTVQQVSDTVRVVNGAVIPITYGTVLKEILVAANNYNQGYYLVTETDKCGNAQKYLVLLDTGYAEIFATVTTGNDNKEQIVFSYDYTTKHAGVMNYTEFLPQILSDSLDEHVIMTITGRNLSNSYIKGDELPTLNYLNGYYGRYTITLYDRSSNAFSFEITVAGAPPSVSHTSLNNATKCTFNVELGDSSNALTAIKMYKVAYNGIYHEMVVDDDGTAVSVANSSYVVRFGGKYVLRLTDVFGREVETEPIFYLKGLPTGTLKGVKEGEVTNGDVSLVFSSDCSIELYELADGEWWQSDLLTLGTEKNDLIATLLADKVSGDRQFKFLLYVTEERNLFVEYRFRVRRVTPTVQVTTLSGANVLFGDSIKEDFCVTWTGNYDVTYIKLGSTFATSNDYRKGEYISGSGAWQFTVTDDVGNEVVFTVHIDETVDYTVDGAYMLSDGAMHSKTGITVTLNEVVRIWNVTSSNGLVVNSGDRLTQDGAYDFYIEDYVGNTASFTVVIDKTAPTVTILASDGSELMQGAITNKNFSVSSVETNVIIKCTFGGITSDYYGEICETDGVYSFEIKDLLGNATTFTVTLKKNLSFAVNGTYKLTSDGAYFTKNGVSIEAIGILVRFEVSSNNGVTFAVGERVSVEGEYTVIIEDNAGNVETVHIVVDKTAPTVTLRKLSGEKFEMNSSVNEGFAVACSEDNVTIRYSSITVKNLSYDGQALTGEDVYSFTVTDLVGNVTEFTVTVDKMVEFSVSGYTTQENGVYVSNGAITVTSKEKIARFDVSNNQGLTFALGERIAAEGEHIVTLEDIAGNKTTFFVVIDKTPPVINITGVSAGGTTGSSVALTLSDGIEMKQIDNAGNALVLLGKAATLSEHGEYIVRAYDVAGNVSTVRFNIDKRVDVSFSGIDYVGQYVVGAVSFEFGEKVTVAATKNEEPLNYKKGKLTDSGTYVITVTDSLGNVFSRAFTILPQRAKSFDFDCGAWSVSVLKDGNTFIDAVLDNRVKLDLSGNYILTFENDVVKYDLALSVFNEPPAVDLVKDGYTYVVSGSNEYTYVLEKDGDEISFTLGNEITSNGNYVLTVTDVYGNVATYEFEIKRLNGASITLIVFAVIAVGAVVFLVIHGRKRGGIR